MVISQLNYQIILLLKCPLTNYWTSPVADVIILSYDLYFLLCRYPPPCWLSVSWPRSLARSPSTLRWRISSPRSFTGKVPAVDAALCVWPVSSHLCRVDFMWPCSRHWLSASRCCVVSLPAQHDARSVLCIVFPGGGGSLRLEAVRTTFVRKKKSLDKGHVFHGWVRNARIAKRVSKSWQMQKRVSKLLWSEF